MSTITKFCGVRSYRDWMNKPMRSDGHLYATNGHIAIRTPDDAAIDAALPDDGNALLKLFAKFAPDAMTWHAIPPFEASKCGECGGSGRATICPDCDGEGEFDHGRHTYNCHECNGGGYVGAGKHDSHTVACADCSGTGINPYDGQDVGHAHYAKRYLSLIRECFPCAQIGVPADAHATAMWRAGDVIGALMPMRRPE